MDQTYLDYTVDRLEKLINIPSPSGYTAEASAFIKNELAALGYEPEMTRKGGVFADFGGADASDGVVLLCHTDTLGGVVSEVKDNGRLRISAVGGLALNNVEGENVRVLTRGGKTFTGAFQLENASLHVNPEYRDTKRSFDNMEVVPDEMTRSKDETRALGMENGCYVAFEPRFIVTPSGYIKSRYLDDKLCCAIILAFAKYLRDKNIVPARRVYAHFTTFEEVGHGGSASVPDGASEIIAVDMGCVGKGLACDETMVAICAKDASGPYHYETTSALIEAAKKCGLKYSVDVYASYATDASAAIRAGNDLRHACVGPGVYASHGYERCHTEGIVNTFDLLAAYLL